MKLFFSLFALLCCTSLNAQDRQFGPSGETVVRIDLSALDEAVLEMKQTVRAPTGIHAVQGSGDISPLAGSTVTVQGVVTGDFQDGLRGFYLQEEDADVDADSTTSEGIFVFAQTPEVAVGDLVTVTAEVEEYFGQTQLRGADAGASITVNRRGVPLPAAVPLTLPQSAAALEAREGMRVSPQDIVVTRVDNLDRFGEVEVTSGERLAQFTECHRPDSAAYRAYLAELATDVLVIDDGRGGSNLEPVRLPDGSTLSATNSLRAGQTIQGLTGVLGYGFDRYRLQPTETAVVTFGGEVRPESAPEVGGDLRVVSANVLNYFTTLGSRGAETDAELQRQEAKIIAALCALRGDIVGLLEIENNDNVALQRLTDALNAACGLNYAYVRSPDTGEDEIAVALIYRSDRLEESGTAATLSTPRELFVGRGSNRVPLAQTFRVIDPASDSQGEEVTVAVNHFKSKGSGCGAGDDDTTRGAGNCNGTRTAAARAVADWLATHPTGVAEENILVVGDLNSYRMEDPIEVFREAGYHNTKTMDNDRFPCGGGPPSYVFGGQWGSLDYALASAALAPRVTGATAWTVNAPEPDVLDYRQTGTDNALYAPDFYRFSDHDPIVVGLDLSATTGTTKGKAAAPIRLERRGDVDYAFVGVTRGGRYLLSDAGGQVIASGTVEAGTHGQFSVAGLPAGIYFVVLNSPGAAPLTFKVVVP
ncbi:putative extracellular nuclease [Lewinella marina]|uniref:Endonuclease/exonuclease/phosphatase domain-containing protein n=1 Tax=Neolewinella marina TaxID=438751 RepID=A0A2G0CGC2_9BACT|nr:ExeM/NucH family extracellular endonuclease [Neolewinella marina]NJB86525.1 putative extracellular nuclease [Neolewinella marina]PHK99021.1 hypothetical protein CGL56_06045 [Neolewinella marina]